jgi:hypothetical protein
MTPDEPVDDLFADLEVSWLREADLVDEWTDASPAPEPTQMVDEEPPLPPPPDSEPEPEPEPDIADEVFEAPAAEPAIDEPVVAESVIADVAVPPPVVAEPVFVAPDPEPVLFTPEPVLFTPEPQPAPEPEPEPPVAYEPDPEPLPDVEPDFWRDAYPHLVLDEDEAPTAGVEPAAPLEEPTPFDLSKFMDAPLASVESITVAEPPVAERAVVDADLQFDPAAFVEPALVVEPGPIVMPPVETPPRRPSVRLRASGQRRSVMTLISIVVVLGVGLSAAIIAVVSVATVLIRHALN